MNVGGTLAEVFVSEFGKPLKRKISIQTRQAGVPRGPKILGLPECLPNDLLGSMTKQSPRPLNRALPKLPRYEYLLSNLHLRCRL